MPLDIFLFYSRTSYGISNAEEELQPNCPLSQRMFSSARLKHFALLGTFPLLSILAILAFLSITCMDDRKVSCLAIEAG